VVWKNYVEDETSTEKGIDGVESVSRRTTERSPNTPRFTPTDRKLLGIERV